MMNKSEICLCLTGTIKPGNVPDLKRVNPIEREQDYYLAIEKWMKLGYPLVFVENSGYNSALISSLFDGKLNCEYISFKSETSHLGKSNGEAEILIYAFGASKIIHNSNTIVKVSGRQYVTNASNILKAIGDQNPYVVGWLKRELQYADSRFFVANIDFYKKYLIKEFDSIDESNYIYFEHVLARAIHRCMADGNIWSLPNEYPIFKGISATDNVKYNNDFLTVLKGNIIIKLAKRLLKSEFL